MTDEKKKGKIVIISGFSGAGKGTVVKQLMETYDNYKLSVSMTTRKPRENEEHGVNYYFVTKEEFEKTIREGGFLEYARYGDHYYGTPKGFVTGNLNAGNNVILEIEVQGAEQIMKMYPDTISIFLAAPSAQELQQRLVGRGSESHEEITKRLMAGIREAEKMRDYDYVLINRDLDKCVSEIDRIVRSDTKEHRYDRSFKERFVKDLERIVEKRIEERKEVI